MFRDRAAAALAAGALGAGLSCGLCLAAAPAWAVPRAGLVSHGLAGAAHRPSQPGARAAAQGPAARHRGGGSAQVDQGATSGGVSAFSLTTSTLTMTGDVAAGATTPTPTGNGHANRAGQGPPGTATPTQPTGPAAVAPAAPAAPAAPVAPVAVVVAPFTTLAADAFGEFPVFIPPASAAPSGASHPTGGPVVAGVSVPLVAAAPRPAGEAPAGGAGGSAALPPTLGDALPPPGALRPFLSLLPRLDGQDPRVIARAVARSPFAAGVAVAVALVGTGLLARRDRRLESAPVGADDDTISLG
ncbi:MAG TPA: hypothetical protein VFP61_11160 [Acidimicrobiales bacterium]|nr:hypothetical protein [Acidimicrobiales bacterium]